VLGFDNLVTGSARNVEHIRSDLFEFRSHDVTDVIELDGPVDFVLHLASPASPVDYENHPVETLNVGTLGTLNLLELARRKQAVFLLASTSEVYGDPLVHPQREDYWGNVNPIGPRACYDEAKRCAEAYTSTYNRRFGVETRIVRIFNTHGPRMRLNDGRVIPNFMTQALRGEPLTVYGDGSQTRSLCYVDDMVAGIIAVLDHGDSKPFNLGNPHEVTVLELAHTIRDLASSRSEIVFKPLPQDDPRQRQPDITRARKLLGWEPSVGLEDGLRRTLEYFRAQVA
jgi:dTDP-glucose 4,6-dehydratase